MLMPTVDNRIVDPDRNIHFNVKAYRTLTKEELVVAVRTAVRMMKRKPKKNSSYEIISLIGLRD